jgi:hypothetical protein
MFGPLSARRAPPSGDGGTTPVRLPGVDGQLPLARHRHPEAGLQSRAGSLLVRRLRRVVAPHNAGIGQSKSERRAGERQQGDLEHGGHFGRLSRIAFNCHRAGVSVFAIRPVLAAASSAVRAASSASLALSCRRSSSISARWSPPLLMVWWWAKARGRLPLFDQEGRELDGVPLSVPVEVVKEC